MAFKTTSVVIGLSLSALLALTCLVMSIVFTQVPSLTYPNIFVNVVATNANSTQFQFNMRCDQADNDGALINLQKACGTESFNVQPGCRLPPYHGYLTIVYGLGEMNCPSGYLKQFRSTVDLGTNFVALAFSLCFIFMFIFLIPFFILYIYMTCSTI
jgi:hypothetical protein